MKKIIHGDLIRVDTPLEDMQSSAYRISIKGFDVSIVKWRHDWYHGDYEIYSYEELFRDVERYSTMGEVLDRLNEIRCLDV